MFYLGFIYDPIIRGVSLIITRVGLIISGGRVVDSKPPPIGGGVIDSTPPLMAGVIESIAG